MAGLTLDTGALIGFERQDRRVLLHLKNAQRLGQELTVPTAVRNDRVLTSDIHDLDRLRFFFPTVRLLST
jgi:hypothetical protein